MKNADELRALEATCTEVLSSRVQVLQYNDGTITFTYPASKHGHRLTALPWGSTLDGQELWKFKLDDVETDPIGTLEPLMICGLLHF